MNEQEFWRKKISHYLNSSSDTAAGKVATGADCPMLPADLQIQASKKMSVTHPLANAPQAIEFSDSETFKQLAKVENFAEKNADIKELKESFFKLWRRLREDSTKNESSPDSWNFKPADSRCPDHSIWEYNRITSALAYVHKKLEKDGRQDVDYPWLFSFALRPVQEFLSQARKSQDLWVGSMLLAELTWAAHRVVIEHFGPDVIIYPDLCGNLRADISFYKHHPQALPKQEQNVATRAGVIPHTFVAILPRGTKENGNYLVDMEQIGEKCCQAVRDKWEELSQDVKKWMESQLKTPPPESSNWIRLWKYCEKTCPLEPTWIALPWPVVEKQEEYFLPGRALPAQKNVPVHSEKDKAVINNRFQQLGQWMEANVWSSYEYTLSVFAQTNPQLLLHSGVLYAAAHHKLKVQHGMRRRILTLPKESPAEASYEKCTICRMRGALNDSEPSQLKQGNCESIRQQVREFWKIKEFDPEQQGSERLCPVCAVRRFLVQSDSGRADNKEPNSFNRIWMGAGKNLGAGRTESGDNRVRTPFPSTVQIAAQKYLSGLAKHAVELETELRQIILLHEKLGLQKTSFARALPQLADAARTTNGIGREYLMLDPQLALFPEMVESRQQYEDKDNVARKNQWGELVRAVSILRKKADKVLEKAPGTQLAVLTMDGDEMGQLLLGNPAKIKALWKDVLHPDIVNKLREQFGEEGWGDLLNLERQTGPSLHAFISRVLADFSHHVIPWVVEQEFNGRLIYSGGDDLLALVPADEALPLGERLRAIFTAPWIVDTMPDTVPWAWLDKNWTKTRNSDAARNRFEILAPYTSRMQQAGRLRAMMGESGTLSAGIMCGHFKTRMGLLLEKSHTLLEDWAKGKAGRNGVGFGHLSRGGIKTMTAASWILQHPDKQSSETIYLEKAIQMIVQAFREGKLSSALPYKLEEITKQFNPYDVKLDLDETTCAKHLHDILKKVYDREQDEKLHKAVLYLWLAGNRLKAKKYSYCGVAEDVAISPLAGLYFCRFLANRTEAL